MEWDGAKWKKKVFVSYHWEMWSSRSWNKTHCSKGLTLSCTRYTLSIFMPCNQSEYHSNHYILYGITSKLPIMCWAIFFWLCRLLTVFSMACYKLVNIQFSLMVYLTHIGYEMVDGPWGTYHQASKGSCVYRENSGLWYVHVPWYDTWKRRIIYFYSIFSC